LRSAWKRADFVLLVSLFGITSCVLLFAFVASEVVEGSAQRLDREIQLALRSP